MAYTYHQLKDMTVVQLREIAQGVQHEALEGFSTMHKDHLLPALCKALNIHIHETASGDQKSQLKARMRQLKTQRESTHEKAKLAELHHELHRLERQLRHLAPAKT